MILPAAFLELAADAATLKLDFAKLDPCPKGSADEIIVCGSRDRQSRYRLPNLPHGYDRKPLRAEGTIAGTHVRAHAESEVRPDGLVDKRVMITFSVPF